ncbi:thermonuclease family protein [Aliterella atlantica]|uniref:thermonuclease family protein n=1 Tax=Aliterella atlantica TaxID=1827278 RepID=UPI000695C948|nr:thermonuclease family protein [Aliterella atlantica]
METRAWIAVTLLLLGGCSTGAANIQSDRIATGAIAQVPLPTPTTSISPRTNTLPRTLKLKLTLDTPADLKVVQGQQVVKEQILSDRTLARERLMAQRQVLLLKLEQLKKPQSSLSAKSPNPESSYAEERAKIAQAKLEVDQAQKAIFQFLANSPWTEYAREQGYQPSEKEKLVGLNNILAQKKASLNLAIAGLQSAKERHREEVNKEVSKEAQQQEDTSLEQAQLLAQLNSIESELERFGVVKSPYTGSIKKIKWVGQTDAELVAELTIAVSDNTPETPVAEPSPRTTGPSPRTAIAPATAKVVPTPIASSPRTEPVGAIAQVDQNSTKLSPRTKPSPQKATIKPQNKVVQNSTAASNSPGKGFAPTWEVLNVHDGDTLKVRQGQKIERVRFACIDAPELAQPLGKESRDYLKSLIAQNGDLVALKIVDTDRYGRKVAEVFAGSKFLQAEQVKGGMAYVYDRYLNNCPDAAAVKQAQNSAQASRVGVWSGNYTKPWDYRKTKRN